MVGTPLHVKKFPIDELQRVHLETGWGDLQVIGGEYEEVTVEVYAVSKNLMNFFVPRTLTADEFRALGYTIQRSEGVLKIVSNRPFDWISTFLDGCKVSLRVFTPFQTDVYLRSRLGDVSVLNVTGEHFVNNSLGKMYFSKVTGKVQSERKNWGNSILIDHCEGDFKLDVAGGNIKVYHSSGEHTYNTDGGNINIGDFNGKLQVKTKGGNIEVNSLQGELKAITWGGNVKMYGLRGNIAATSKGGNIYAEVEQLKEYYLLESSGGNVRSVFPENAAMHLQARGSKVRNKAGFRINGQNNYQRIDGLVNGGGAEVMLKANAGNVRIESRKTFEAKFNASPYPMNTHHSPKEEVESNHEGKYEILKNVETPPPADKIKREPIRRINERATNRKKEWARTTRMMSLSNIIYALFFAILLSYGLNSVTYFTTELFNPTSLESTHNKAVFILNLVTGLAAFINLVLFLTFIEGRIRLHWLRYVTVSVTAVLVYFVLQFIILKALIGRENLEDFWKLYLRIIQPNQFEVKKDFSTFFYGGMPSFVSVIFYYIYQRSSNLSRKIGEQEYQLLNLEKMKTQAQLNALEARINPHFLYNSLNSIAGLIHENPDRAEDMTIELSKLFRATTGRTEAVTHRIDEEISLVKSYLQLEQMRFGARLVYEIEVEDKLNEVLIPRFLLQPLVENAIKHGISKIEDEGLITIRISTEGPWILIQIHDNGPAFGESLSSGYGLKSVREKLRLIYGEHAHLEIVEAPLKMLEIRIEKTFEIVK